MNTPGSQIYTCDIQVALPEIAPIFTGLYYTYIHIYNKKPLKLFYIPRYEYSFY